jgi:hypothetical protein
VVVPASYADWGTEAVAGAHHVVPTTVTVRVAFIVAFPAVLQPVTVLVSPVVATVAVLLLAPFPQQSPTQVPRRLGRVDDGVPHFVPRMTHVVLRLMMSTGEERVTWRAKLSRSEKTLISIQKNK